MKVVALVGSLRKDSLNRKVLQALAARAPQGMTVELRELHGIPVYDGDLETDGLPALVTTLQDAIVAADGLLIGSPEYNGGVPGPLKNAIDWCSRADRRDEVFKGRKTALVGTTPGPAGTRHAQQAWLQVFRTCSMDFWMAGQLYLASGHELFDAEGELVDPKMSARFEAFMKGFAAFIQR